MFCSSKILCSSLLLTILASSVTGQYKDWWSACPTYTKVTGFQSSLYDGVWYVYKQIPETADIFVPKSCKSFTYSATTNAFNYDYRAAGTVQQITGQYSLTSTDSGVFKVTLDEGGVLGADSSRNVNQYVVAGDDGATYMIIQSCTNTFSGFPRSLDYGYVLTRERTPTTTTTIDAAVTAAFPGLNLITVGQTGC